LSTAAFPVTQCHDTLPMLRAAAIVAGLRGRWRWGHGWHTTASVWQVTELDGPHVLLSGPSGVRRVSAVHLLADPSSHLGDAPRDPVEGTGANLAGLKEAGRPRLVSPPRHGLENHSSGAAARTSVAA
jgi:hypothetical protein